MRQLLESLFISEHGNAFNDHYHVTTGSQYSISERRLLLLCLFEFAKMCCRTSKIDESIRITLVELEETDQVIIGLIIESSWSP